MRRALVNIILIAAFASSFMVIVLPFLAEARFDKAKALESAFRWAKARESYISAVRLDPFDSVYIAALGEFLLKKSDFQRDGISWLEAAGKSYSRALRLNRACAEYSLGLGMAELSLGMLLLADRTRAFQGNALVRKAMEDLKEALEKDPNGFTVSYSFGYAAVKAWNLLSADDKQLVSEKLTYALRLRPLYARLVYPLVWRQTGDFRLLQKMTPAKLESQEGLYRFMADNNLWQFRREMVDAVNFYKKREAPADIAREITRKRKRLSQAAAIRPQAASRGVVAMTDWRGTSANGTDTYERGKMYWGGTIDAAVDLSPGESTIKIRARGSPAGGAYPYMIVELDGSEIGAVSVDSLEWKEYAFEVDTDGGTKILSITFANDLYDPKRREDRNLFIGEARVEKVAK